MEEQQSTPLKNIGNVLRSTLKRTLKNEDFTNHISNAAKSDVTLFNENLKMDLPGSGDASCVLKEKIPSQEKPIEKPDYPTGIAVTNDRASEIFNEKISCDLKSEEVAYKDQVTDASENEKQSPILNCDSNFKDSPLKENLKTNYKTLEKEEIISSSNGCNGTSSHKCMLPTPTNGISGMLRGNYGPNGRENGELDQNNELYMQELKVKNMDFLSSLDCDAHENVAEKSSQITSGVMSTGVGSSELGTLVSNVNEKISKSHTEKIEYVDEVAGLISSVESNKILKSPVNNINENVFGNDLEKVVNCDENLEFVASVESNIKFNSLVSNLNKNVLKSDLGNSVRGNEIQDVVSSVEPVLGITISCVNEKVFASSVGSNLKLKTPVNNDVFSESLLKTSPYKDKVQDLEFSMESNKKFETPNIENIFKTDLENSVCSDGNNTLISSGDANKILKCCGNSVIEKILNDKLGKPISEDGKVNLVSALGSNIKLKTHETCYETFKRDSEKLICVDDVFFVESDKKGETSVDKNALESDLEKSVCDEYKIFVSSVESNKKSESAVNEICFEKDLEKTICGDENMVIVSSVESDVRMKTCVDNVNENVLKTDLENSVCDDENETLFSSVESNKKQEASVTTVNEKISKIDFENLCDEIEAFYDSIKKIESNVNENALLSELGKPECEDEKVVLDSSVGLNLKMNALFTSDQVFSESLLKISHNDNVLDLVSFEGLNKRSETPANENAFKSDLRNSVYNDENVTLGSPGLKSPVNGENENVLDNELGKPVWEDEAVILDSNIKLKAPVVNESEILKTDLEKTICCDEVQTLISSVESKKTFETSTNNQKNVSKTDFGNSVGSDENETFVCHEKSNKILINPVNSINEKSLDNELGKPLCEDEEGILASAVESNIKFKAPLSNDSEIFNRESEKKMCCDEVQALVSSVESNKKFESPAKNENIFKTGFGNLLCGNKDFVTNGNEVIKSGINKKSPIKVQASSNNIGVKCRKSGKNKTSAKTPTCALAQRRLSNDFCVWASQIKSSTPYEKSEDNIFSGDQASQPLLTPKRNVKLRPKKVRNLNFQKSTMKLNCDELCHAPIIQLKNSVPPHVTEGIAQNSGKNSDTFILSHGEENKFRMSCAHAIDQPGPSIIKKAASELREEIKKMKYDLTVQKSIIEVDLTVDDNNTALSHLSHNDLNDPDPNYDADFISRSVKDSKDVEIDDNNGPITKASECVAMQQLSNVGKSVEREEEENNYYLDAVESNCNINENNEVKLKCKQIKEELTEIKANEEQEIYIIEDLCKKVPKTCDNFVSDDPKENEDNNNPEWEFLKKLESDDERYKAVRKRWRSLVIPDPNKNLTCIHIKSTFKHPSIVQFDQNKVENENLRSSRKRTMSHEPTSSDRVPVKRARTRSCTTSYDIKVQNHFKKMDEEEKKLCERKKSALAVSENYYNQQYINLMRSNLWFYNFREYNNRYAWLTSQQQKAQEDVHRTFAGAFDRLENEKNSKIAVFKRAMKEVEAFHKFYRKLDEESSKNDCFFLTDAELDDVMETDKLYEEFDNFYH